MTTSGQVYSKAKPYINRIYQATVQAKIPDAATDGGWAELIRHQVQAENDFRDPNIIEDVVDSMKIAVGIFINELKDHGASWRDIYGAAAASRREGVNRVGQAIDQAGSHRWDDFKKYLLETTQKFVEGNPGGVSVFYDFTNWGWFDGNWPIAAPEQRSDPMQQAAPVMPSAKTKEKMPWWVWLIMAIGGGGVLLAGGKTKGKKRRKS